MNTIFDIPAHPLMVHFPVVAIPILALVGLVMTVRPRFRERYSRPILLLGIVTVISTFLAAKSGESLVESLDLTDEFIDPHRDLGNMLRFFVLGQTVAIGAMVVVNKRSTATGRDPAHIATAALVICFSLLSLVWTVRTGHEGAKAVWGSGDAGAADDDDGIDAAPLDERSDADADADAVPETVPDTIGAALTGQDVFESNCARCHGTDGGGGRGPSLQGLALDQPDPTEATAQVVNGGNGMPAFGARLDASQIDAAIEYIYATF